MGVVIDSHTHLFLCERPEDDLVAAAEEAGVVRMLNVGLDAETNTKAIAAAARHESVFATVGCHPTEAAGFDDVRAAEIARLAAESEKVRAIVSTAPPAANGTTMRSSLPGNACAHARPDTVARASNASHRFMIASSEFPIFL